VHEDGGHQHETKTAELRDGTHLRTALHLAFDESEHVLLVHTRRVMNMSVDLSRERNEHESNERSKNKCVLTFRTL